MKRPILATVALFFAWGLLDFIIHGILLNATYIATAELWRPTEEMNMGMMYIVTLISAACFVAIYTKLVAHKSVKAGMTMGLLFGIATGVSMGFGTYTVMPIPLSLAWGWLIGTVVETVVGGAIVGAIVITPAQSTPSA